MQRIRYLRRPQPPFHANQFDVRKDIFYVSDTWCGYLTSCCKGWSVHHSDIQLCRFSENRYRFYCKTAASITWTLYFCGWFGLRTLRLIILPGSCVSHIPCQQGADTQSQYSFFSFLLFVLLNRRTQQATHRLDTESSSMSRTACRSDAAEKLREYRPVNPLIRLKTPESLLLSNADARDNSSSVPGEIKSTWKATAYHFYFLSKRNRKKKYFILRVFLCWKILYSTDLNK